MEKELFTCQMTAEEVKKRERSMSLMLKVWWYSMTGRYGETTDIFLLPDEGPIVLESEFNSKVHNFLQFHKEMYHLPKPRSVWFRLRYYDR